MDGGACFRQCNETRTHQHQCSAPRSEVVFDEIIIGNYTDDRFACKRLANQQWLLIPGHRCGMSRTWDRARKNQLAKHAAERPLRLRWGPLRLSPSSGAASNAAFANLPRRPRPP